MERINPSEFFEVIYAGKFQLGQKASAEVREKAREQFVASIRRDRQLLRNRTVNKVVLTKRG